MYCQLCRAEATATHAATARHRAARELAAAAVDRLTNHLAEEFTEGETTKAPAETDSTEVTFCDICNMILPVTELSSHYRQKTHTLALLNDQTLEELVLRYLDQDSKLLEPSGPREDITTVEKAEAVKKYTCHLCALDIPVVFKTEHDSSSRHRASRALAAAAARRVRDSLAPKRTDDKSGDKSEDESKDKSKESGDRSKDPEDQSNNESGDVSADKKFTGKMMKKLLKAYTGRVIDEDTFEQEEPEPTKTKRLTAKEYFTNILPYMSYLGTYYNIIVDDTEFVTLQIGRDILRVHVNNINGLYDWGGQHVMCRLCDGFQYTYYSSVEEQDKQHVMSLGHIKNVLSPIDNVHLIRKVDETHSICVLCTANLPAYLVEDHILKDPRHTVALNAALDRGKNYKDSKEHLKITIYTPEVKKPGNYMKPNQFNNPNPYQQNNWQFGIPRGKNSGVLFGNAQNNSFGSARNSDYAHIHGQPEVVNSSSHQNNASVFGTQGTNAAFGNPPNSGYGGVQNHGQHGMLSSSSNQNNASVFGTQGTNAYGSPPKVGFGLLSSSSQQNNAPAFGSAQNTTGFGNTQNNAQSFGNAQNTESFGNVQQNTSFGFGSQNKSGNFGTALYGTQPQVQFRVFGSGQPQQSHTTNSPAQNTPGFGGTQNNVPGFNQNQSINTVSLQNNAIDFTAAQPKAQHGLNTLPQNDSKPISGQTQIQPSNAINTTEQNKNIAGDAPIQASERRHNFADAQSQSQSNGIRRGSAQQDKGFDFGKAQTEPPSNTVFLNMAQMSVKRTAEDYSSSDSD